VTGNAPAYGYREAHVVLPGDPEATFRATVGCNQPMGRYQHASESLAFSAAASTRMACPPPLDLTARSLSAALDATRTVRQAGQTVFFENGNGQPVAEFTAPYLRQLQAMRIKP
jgi:heat shock protein HslJ